MRKKIEVQQFVHETLQNFGRIDFLSVQYKDETVFHKIKKYRRWYVLRAIEDMVSFLDKTNTLNTAEAIVTQRHNVILILHTPYDFAENTLQKRSDLAEW